MLAPSKEVTKMSTLDGWTKCLVMLLQTAENLSPSINFIVVIAIKKTAIVQILCTTSILMVGWIIVVRISLATQVDGSNIKQKFNSSIRRFKIDCMFCISSGVQFLTRCRKNTQYFAHYIRDSFPFWSSRMLFKALIAETTVGKHPFSAFKCISIPNNSSL